MEGIEEKGIAEVAKIRVNSEEDLRILTEIEEKVMNQVHLGLTPRCWRFLIGMKQPRASSSH